MVDRSSATQSQASRADPFALCGTTIASKYQVSSVVGKGGFGVVYRGVHTGFDEPIAVKCLKIDPDLDDEQRQELLQRLQEEGRVLHRLSRLSSSIVQALDVGAIDSPNDQWVPYLVMEWLEGETLAQHLRHRRASEAPNFTVAEALELLGPAAEALSLAHQQKVAHRDVKPENLYFTEVGSRRTVKVLDFGIAKVLSQQASFTAAPAATKQQQPAVFTPSYGAPEQFNKKRGATGPWTDVFALALIVVEMVTGERALHGDDATQLYIAAADPASRPTPRYHGADTSDAIEQVMAQALAIEPADRFQDAGSFWRALQAAAAGKAQADDPATRDVSDTGEFVSRHDLELSGDDLSAAPAPVAREVAPSRPPRSLQPSASGRTTEPSIGADAAAADSLREGSGSSRWLPLVVVLALAGAALAYVQLRKVGTFTPTLDSASANTAPTLNTPSATFTAGPRPPQSASAPASASSHPSAAPSGSADAGAPLSNAGGQGGASADGGGGQGGSAAPVPVAPAGMTLIQPAPDSALKPFFLDRTEVLLSAYRECVMAGRCVRATRVVLTPKSAGALGVKGVTESTKPEQLAEAWGGRCNEVRSALDHPVNCVNHGSANDYCRFRTKRLPTSAEWTLAAAGEAARRFPWGDDQPECSTACFGLNGSCIGSARQVASCKAGVRQRDVTPRGLLDMGGNVSEWVQDAGQRAGPGEPAWRILRGGNFGDEANWLPVSKLRAVPPVTAHVTIGFRCAQSVE